jgi:hypothetical protein
MCSPLFLTVAGILPVVGWDLCGLLQCVATPRPGASGTFSVKPRVERRELNYEICLDLELVVQVHESRHNPLPCSLSSCRSRPGRRMTCIGHLRYVAMSAATPYPIVSWRHSRSARLSISKKCGPRDPLLVLGFAPERNRGSQHATGDGIRGWLFLPAIAF